MINWKLSCSTMMRFNVQFIILNRLAAIAVAVALHGGSLCRNYITANSHFRNRKSLWGHIRYAKKELK